MPDTRDDVLNDTGIAFQARNPLLSSSHHLSCDYDCLKDKGENYQNCSVLCFFSDIVIFVLKRGVKLQLTQLIESNWNLVFSW